MKQQRLSYVVRTIRTFWVDAILCGACGALYGVVIGGFGAQARNELTFYSLILFATRCGLVGGVVGTIVCLFREAADSTSDDTSIDSDSSDDGTALNETKNLSLTNSNLEPVVKHLSVVLSPRSNPPTAA